jgi:hypothetical protein
MLSTNYRIRLEKIAEKISNGEAVELGDMIWAEKLSAHNASAATILRRARRKSQNPNMVEGDMDDFLNQLDLGDPDPSNHKSHFGNVDEIVDFFKRDDTDDETGSWRRRD